MTALSRTLGGIDLSAALDELRTLDRELADIARRRAHLAARLREAKELIEYREAEAVNDAFGLADGRNAEQRKAQVDAFVERARFDATHPLGQAVAQLRELQRVAEELDVEYQNRVRSYRTVEHVIETARALLLYLARERAEAPAPAVVRNAPSSNDDDVLF